jgi:DNA-directed RNA polymerase II subunit RPB2
MQDYEEQFGEVEYDGFGEEDVEDDITAEDCWTVISSFFESKGLVSQQLDSFDEFVCVTIQELVSEVGQVAIDSNVPVAEDEENPIVMRRYQIIFGNVLLGKPLYVEQDGSSTVMMPQQARLRNLTYGIPLYVQMHKKVQVAREKKVDPDTGEEVKDGSLEWELESEDLPKDYAQVFIGRLPMMLKSRYCSLAGLNEQQLYDVDECPYDQGGYFVINGSEKVLIAQERSAANIVQVFKKPPPSPTPYVAEIRSAVEKGSRLISSMQIKLFSKGESGKGGFGQTIKATLPYVNSEIPIAIVFRALGVVSDEDILNHICYNRQDTDMLEMLKPCIEEAFVIQDREVALDFIGRRSTAKDGHARDKRVKHARDILQKEFLPHISQSEGSETRKAFFLGYMVHKMLQCALGRREVDDRDHFGKKRLDLAGPLLANLFRNLFRKLTNDMSTSLKKSVEGNKDFNLALAVRSNTITNGLKYSLATGNWGDQKKAASTKAGVSQVLNRFTFASTLSHLRRTNTPIGRDGKIAKPRQLHNTHWGLVCPAETPEGQACGLVKNLALMCYITVGTPMDPIVEFMKQRGMELLEEYEPHRAPQSTKVFVNGVWVGVHRDPSRLVELVYRLRRSNTISHEVGLVRDIRDREFKIFTDAGRVCRPLFVINNDSSTPNTGQLVLSKEHIRKLEADKELPAELSPEERKELSFGWEGLVKGGVVEYIDAEEEETVMIVMTPEDLEISRQVQAGYAQPDEIDDENLNKRVKAKVDKNLHTWTHCEIHPSMILGICASIIPFPDHNQVCPNLTSPYNLSLTFYSPLVIPTNLPWANKPWVSSSPISINGSIPCRTFYTTHKSL